MKKIKIKHILFEVSNKCNFSCRYCYFFDDKKRKELNTIGAKNAIKVFKEKFSGETIGFTGGEPFLRNDLFEVLEYARSLGLKTAVGTNGSLIKKSNIPKIRKFINTLIISLDGDEDYFEFITRTKKYNKVLNSFQILKKANIKFGAHCNITPINLVNFDKILNLIKENGATFVQIGDVQFARRLEKQTRRLRLNPKERKQLYKLIENYPQDKSFFIIHKFLDSSNYKKLNKACFSPFFVVKPDGSFYPMVGISEKWKLADNLSSFDSIKKLVAFKRILNKAQKICEERIKKEGVVSPYDLIANELTEL
jgi:MoaA/NifB/PqqE/SkfB family radical SAM enzyme